MKPEELSIGDWVNILNYHYDGRPYIGQVDGIVKKHGTYYLQFGSALSAEIDKCEPIPITEEILKKNFEEKYGEIYGIYEDYFDLEIHEFNDGMYILHYHCSEMSIPDTQIVGICWVHELQHALRLCGTSKTIDL